MERIKNIGKSKKFGRTLREQNAKRYGIDNQILKGLESFYCRTDTDKFTIVELLFRGRRYHGLSAKSDQDMSNLSEGIAHAYSRAFDNMVYDVVLDIQPNYQWADHAKIRMPDFFHPNKKLSKNTVINIGGLPVKDPQALADSISSYDIAKIECQHCGEISNYFLKTLNLKTKCPACDKRLSEPRTPQKS